MGPHAPAKERLGISHTGRPVERILEGPFFDILRYKKGQSVLISVVFTPSPPSHHGTVWLLPAISINYLCTYDLYGPVRNVFDAGRYIMYVGKWEGVRPWKSRAFWAL